MTDINRKTGIPVKGIPEIVDWLLKNCTTSELFFMANMADNKEAFGMLTRIFTRLTNYNIHEVFYEKHIQDGVQLMVYRAAKRGEVAGLKAFQMACQAARDVITERARQEKEKRRRAQEDEE